MNKYLEYLKLVPKFFTNADKIIEGWINDAKLEHGSLSKEDEAIIITRRAICSECPFNSFNLRNNDALYKEMFKEDFKTDRSDEFCGICSCPLVKKTASLASNCGIENWNLEHPEQKLELKWKAK